VHRCLLLEDVHYRFDLEGMRQCFSVGVRRDEHGGRRLGILGDFPRQTPLLLPLLGFFLENGKGVCVYKCKILGRQRRVEEMQTKFKRIT